MAHTLLLDRDFLPMSVLPLSVVDWQTAIKMVFLDRVYVLENYPNWVVRSEKLSMPVPSVCVSREPFRQKKSVKFSRLNLYLRDHYTCQYCGGVFKYSELTIDHVVPRSSGGKTTWANCVSSCYACNQRKADRLLRPIKLPIKPDYYNLLHAWTSGPIKVHNTDWLKYLGATELAA